MTARAPETEGGLRIGKDCHGWGVWHTTSGLAAVTGLRQKRFAVEARAALLATGTDFTDDARAVQKDRNRWVDVYFLWERRSHATGIDPETWEFYPASIRYGQRVPSAAEAAEMRGQ
jgi:hypothetical protein